MEDNRLNYRGPNDRNDGVSIGNRKTWLRCRLIGLFERSRGCGLCSFQIEIFARQKLPDAVDHIVQLRLCELRIDRQRQSFLGRGFAAREVACFVPKIGEALLHVHGHRVVNFRSNPLIFQEGL